MIQETSQAAECGSVEPSQPPRQYHKRFFQNGSYPVPSEKMATQRYQEESWGWEDGSGITELVAQTGRNRFEAQHGPQKPGMVTAL